MSLLARFAVAMLRAYKRWLSPLLPRACRFSPTCSEYAQLAVGSHGLVAGTWLTLGRLLRCQPLGRGGLDLPPPARVGGAASGGSVRLAASLSPESPSSRSRGASS